jgi:hypothetical protein
MIRDYLIIKDDTIINTVKWDKDANPDFYSDDVIVVEMPEERIPIATTGENDNQVISSWLPGKGDKYVDSKFVRQEYTKGAVIKDDIVIDIVIWNPVRFSLDPYEGSDGIVKLGPDVTDYIGFSPTVGDRFITTGNEYSVPPGTFISSNP